MCFSTVACVTTSASAMPWLDFPFRHGGEHGALARAEPIEWPVSSPAPQQPSNDLGIERTAAGSDSGNGVGESVDVAYALSEQIADTLVMPAELDRVLLLMELRQHEDSGSRPLPAQLQRGTKAVVLVTRRHLHTDKIDARVLAQLSFRNLVPASGCPTPRFAASASWRASGCTRSVSARA
jgi:hypothetical protein